MRGSPWLLLLTGCLGWLLAVAPEAAAASPLAFDAGAAVLGQNLLEQNSCGADAGVAATEPGSDAAAALECQSGADAAREAAEQRQLAEAANTAAPGSAGAEAPLCDESAASVGAQPFIPEADRGHFEVLPCEALWALLAHALRNGERLEEWRALALRGESPSPPERNDRNPERPHVVREAPLALPARGQPCLFARDPQLGLVACSGHARNVYRPPRSAV